MIEACVTQRKRGFGLLGEGSEWWKRERQKRMVSKKCLAIQMESVR